MHALRFLRTLTSVLEFGCAQARRRIRVLNQCPRPSPDLPPSVLQLFATSQTRANPASS